MRENFDFLITHHACTGSVAAQQNAAHLVLLQGWGMQAGVWDAWLPQLTPHCHVCCVDVSNFPFAEHAGEFFLPNDFLRALLNAAPKNAVWLGWSLGGLVLMELAAQFSAYIRAAFFITSTPCFVQREDGPAAMPADVFAKFLRAFDDDAEKLLKNFAALQSHGSASVKTDARFLQRFLIGNPNNMVHKKNLRAGLQCLQQHDARAAVQKITAPAFFLFGQHDALVPAAAANHTSFSGRMAVMPAAAHAPFVSHPQATAEHLFYFLTQHGVLA